MANWGIAIIEFLGIVCYEVVVALIAGAFTEMSAKRKRRYIFFALLPLAMMTMFHSEDIGNDTVAYTSLFRAVEDMTLEAALSNTRFEKGYMLFTFILTRLFSSRQSVLIAEGAIVYLCLGRWLNKHCKAPGLFICLIVEMLQIDGWMSAMRQSLAMAVLFFAFDALVEKKLFRFVLFVLLAAQFHAVAYVFLLAYPMLWCFREYRTNPLRKNWRFERWMAIGTVGIALLMRPMINLLLKLFPKYQYYVSGAYMDGQARLAIVLKMIVYAMMLLLPLLIRSKGSENKNAVSRPAELSFYRMALVNLAIMVMANQATIFMRFAGIFSIYAIAGFSEQTAQLQCQKNRRIVIILALILFAMYGVIITICRTPEWQTTYPFEWWR